MTIIVKKNIIFVVKATYSKNLGDKMKKKNIFILFLCMFFVGMSFVSADTYNNIDSDALLSCGAGLMTDIPSLIPKVVSIAYTVIQIAVPVVLVIMGSLDLFKGITAQKEDEIKKGQQIFVKRLIAAVLVFFAFVITKILISVVADSTGANILECTECFIENDCDPNI